jgi:hypothetical protein
MLDAAYLTTWLLALELQERHGQCLGTIVQGRSSHSISSFLVSREGEACRWTFLFLVPVHWFLMHVLNESGDRC